MPRTELLVLVPLAWVTLPVLAGHCPLAVAVEGRWRQSFGVPDVGVVAAVVHHPVDLSVVREVVRAAHVFGRSLPRRRCSVGIWEPGAESSCLGSVVDGCCEGMASESSGGMSVVWRGGR